MPTSVDSFYCTSHSLDSHPTGIPQESRGPQDSCQSLCKQVYKRFKAAVHRLTSVMTDFIISCKDVIILHNVGNLSVLPICYLAQTKLETGGFIHGKNSSSDQLKMWKNCQVTCVNISHFIAVNIFYIIHSTVFH